MRSALAALAVVVMCLSPSAVSLTTQSAAAADATALRPIPFLSGGKQFPSDPNIEVFHQPSSGKHRELVLNNLVRLFNNVSHAQIDIAMFDINTPARSKGDAVRRLIDSIATAAKHHNTFKVVLDAKRMSAVPKRDAQCGAHHEPSTLRGFHTSSRQAAKLYCIVTKNGKHRGRFKVCHDGCTGSAQTGPADHNKFVLVSTRSHNYILSSSANWTTPQLENMYQTMVAFYDHNNMFTTWQKYFRALFKHKARAAADYLPATGYYHVTFFPKGTKAHPPTDPQLESLKSVPCHGGGTIEMLTSRFTDTAFANHLQWLKQGRTSTGARKHCTHKVVRVLIPASGPKKFVKRSLLKRINYRCLPNQHSKDLIIDAQGASTVWTGSRPFGGDIYGSADTMVQLNAPGVLKNFKDDFNKKWSLARRCMPSNAG